MEKKTVKTKKATEKRLENRKNTREENLRKYLEQQKQNVQP